jgi:hypothetical protein
VSLESDQICATLPDPLISEILAGSRVLWADPDGTEQPTESARWLGGAMRECRRALAVANELELAEMLAAGPVNLPALAHKTGTHEDSLFRLMRALASLSIFEQVATGFFANSRASEFLRNRGSASAWKDFRKVPPGGPEGWEGLLTSVRNGRTVYENAHGCSIWEYLRRSPDRWTIFNRKMRAISASMTPAVVLALDWSRFPIIADIGGGGGPQLADILNAHTGCAGILFDYPEVLEGAIRHSRIDYAGGDFFHGVPPGANAYVLRNVLHDWAEPEIFTILARIREAMRPASRLIVVEIILPDKSGFDLGYWSDLSMLTLSGGRERNAVEYRALLKQAGFEVEKTIRTSSPQSILIAA